MVEGERKSGQCIESADEGEFDSFMKEISRKGSLDMAFSLALAVRNGLSEVIKLLHARVTRGRDN